MHNHFTGRRVNGSSTSLRPCGRNRSFVDCQGRGGIAGEVWVGRTLEHVLDPCLPFVVDGQQFPHACGGSVRWYRLQFGRAYVGAPQSFVENVLAELGDRFDQELARSGRDSADRYVNLDARARGMRCRVWTRSPMQWDGPRN